MLGFCFLIRGAQSYSEVTGLEDLCKLGATGLAVDIREGTDWQSLFVGKSEVKLDDGIISELSSKQETSLICCEFYASDPKLSHFVSVIYQGLHSKDAQRIFVQIWILVELKEPLYIEKLLHNAQKCQQNSDLLPKQSIQTVIERRIPNLGAASPANQIYYVTEITGIHSRADPKEQLSLTNLYECYKDLELKAQVCFQVTQTPNLPKHFQPSVSQPKHTTKQAVPASTAAKD